MSLIIGLTGGIGSGKSKAAEFFAQSGAEVIDTDLLSHALTQTGSPALAAIRSQIGGKVFFPDNSLNRAALRQLIFTDDIYKAKLEAILHPLIKEEVIARLDHAKSPYVVLVVPLLLEATGYRQLVDRVLVVDCDEATQISRSKARSGLTEAEVCAIMAHQLPRQARLQQADDVLDNSNGMENLQHQVAALHQKYLSLAGATRH